MTGPAVHITGASGAGVSTLGRVLARNMGAVLLDTDDFYWLPTKPPYTQARPTDERLALLDLAIEGASPAGFILSGSIGHWGAPLVPRFNLVVFVRTATEIRLARLEARERQRFDDAALAPGGHRHEAFNDFRQWSSEYDVGPKEGRSLAMHEEFLASLPCPIMRLDGAQHTEALAAEILTTWRGQSADRE
jgi:hypothetical protein